MFESNKIYRCQKCGQIIEVLHEGAGELVCCGEPMELLKANSSDGAAEKHVPVVEKTEKGFRIKIGSVPHPMLPEHFIEWIAVYFEDGKMGRKYLKPSEQPEAEFFMNKLPDKVLAYCNLHGLWTIE